MRVTGNCTCAKTFRAALGAEEWFGRVASTHLQAALHYRAKHLIRLVLPLAIRSRARIDLRHRNRSSPFLKKSTPPDLLAYSSSSSPIPIPGLSLCTNISPPSTMSVRPSPFSGSSSSTPSSRRNFPSRANGAPSPSLQPRSVGGGSGTATGAGTGESYVAPPQRKKSGGPVLSLANGTGATVNGHQDGSASAGLHPLKYTWDVWFSQRQGAVKGAKKDGEGKSAAGQKEKESREDWEGGVVKLGGFSTVSALACAAVLKSRADRARFGQIESLHPMLAHLVPPSELPGSLHSSYTLFTSDAPELAPSPSNTVCDYNVFRSSIAPAWEDAANTGGGRWVLRLRKGVADRIWEEVVFALVSERIGGEDERVGEKVNGAVLSVRREEDILSLWVAPSSRADRDTIRCVFSSPQITRN